MIFKFEDLAFFILAILSLHSNTMTDIAITYELHYRYNYNLWIEILANLPLLANFTKIKLHLKYSA